MGNLDMSIVWILVAVVAILLEIITPSALISIWVAVGAFSAWIAYLLGASVLVQLIICAVVSIVFVVVVRPFAVESLRGNVVATNADRMIGSKVVVTKKITANEWGEVKVNGMFWSAASVDQEEIDEGETVKVVAIEGAKVLVRKIVK